MGGALEDGYRVLGLEDAAGRDEVVRHLVSARIIELASKLNSLRVLEEAGGRGGVVCDGQAAPASLCAGGVAAAAATGLRGARPPRPGPARQVLYDVSTLYFETDAGGGFRESGFSKKRRLEPQITIWLLTGQDGFPLMVSAFEGNRAETKTMLPVIGIHGRPPASGRHRGRGRGDDLGGEPEGDRGRRAVVHLGHEGPQRPYVVDRWSREHSAEEIPDGHVFTQPWPAQPSSKRRDQHGIDEQADDSRETNPAGTVIIWS